jgi:uncharacterized phiE125 gp8 family phage protein
MAVVVVTPRTDEVIPLGIVKAYLRVEHDDHDPLIQMHINAAVAWLDGPTGLLGLSLGPQRLRIEKPGFSGLHGLELPQGPVTEIDSISWLDGLGETQMVDEGLYELVANRVRLVQGAAWPAVGFGRVTIEYQAGYGANDLPPPISAAILMQVKIQYDPGDEKSLMALERARDALLSPFRLRRV